MNRVTVVIEDSCVPIALGMQLAGGRITSASLGDHSELLETAQQLLRALPYANEMAVAERLDIERNARDVIAKAGGV